MDATTVETTAENMETNEGRKERVSKIAKHHILASMGVGLIPVPLVDLAALTGVQLNMIRKLCKEYDVPFKEDRGKSIVTSLLGGLLSTEIGASLSSLIKCLPVIGQTVGAATMPVIAGASTYAIHVVFVKHFEEGGTILDLDPAKMKSFFTEQFTKGKKTATDMHAEAETSDKKAETEV